MYRAIFLDRDGVICHNRDDYVKSWAEFDFLPGALAALARLADSDLKVVVITNQSAINRGLTSVRAVEEIHERMLRRVGAAGGRIDLVLYCPHRPDEGCECRKPRPGMLLRAAEMLELDLSRSFLVGDARTDLEAGRAAGCPGRYLVLSGRGRSQLSAALRSDPHCIVVPDLAAAVDDILQRLVTTCPARWGISFPR